VGEQISIDAEAHLKSYTEQWTPEYKC